MSLPDAFISGFLQNNDCSEYLLRFERLGKGCEYQNTRIYVVLTPIAVPMKSWIVNGWGMMMGMSVSSGMSTGRGSSASMLNRACAMLSGFSAFWAM